MGNETKIETLEQFRNSARVIAISDKDDDTFHKEAIAAIKYAEFMQIEILKSGKYHLAILNSEYTTRNLKQLEKILWFDFAIHELLQDTEAIIPQLIKQEKFNNKRKRKAWKESRKNMR